MARWYRGGRYYGRNRYYSRYGRRRYYGSSSKRASGNMRAAKQQSDQSTFTINIPSEVTCFLRDDLTLQKETGVYAMNIFEQLRKSDFYQNYANMYDEFKIDKVKVKLLPSSWAANAGSIASLYKNLTVYTAWDRTGLDQNQILFNIDNANQITKVNDLDYILGNENGGGLFCTVGSDITSYSSAESRAVNPNSNTSIVRWLSPKTIQEKSQWLNCADLKKWYESYDSIQGRYYGIPISNVVGKNAGEDISGVKLLFDNAGSVVPFGGVMDQYQSTINSKNPCSLWEDTGIKFKPTLLIGVFPKDNNVVNLGTNEDPRNIPANSMTFNVETEVVCTFRGLRKSRVVHA